MLCSCWPLSRGDACLRKANFSMGESGTQMPWGHLPLKLYLMMVSPSAQAGLLPFNPQRAGARLGWHCDTQGLCLYSSSFDLLAGFCVSGLNARLCPQLLLPLSPCHLLAIVPMIPLAPDSEVFVFILHTVSCTC